MLRNHPSFFASLLLTTLLEMIHIGLRPRPSNEEALGVLIWIVVFVLSPFFLPSVLGYVLRLGLSFSFPPFSAPVRVVKTR